MSGLQPAAKQPRMMKKQAPTPITRTESVAIPLTQDTMEEESDHHTASLPTSSTESKMNMMTARHPKGHKVRSLNGVWTSMDSQDFLHLTDTVTLGDVWVQPTSVEPIKGLYAKVAMKEIIVAPEIFTRDTECKMSLDDLLKILYLNECINWDMRGLVHLSYDEWLKAKSAACVTRVGMEEATNRAKLCDFIIQHDSEFTFYPPYLNGKFGIFFRKICYHEYTSEMGDDESLNKFDNPSMVKCCASKGTFEYIFEARLFPLPDGWFDTTSTTTIDTTLTPCETYPHSSHPVL